MVANTAPIFSKKGRIGAGSAGGTFNVASSTANTAFDGTGTIGTSIWVAFEADGTEGSFLRSIVAKIVSTGVGVATALRLFINNGSTNGTAANNALYKEVSIPAITATQAAGTPDFEIPCNIALPASYRILYSFGTAPVNLWMVFGIGGDY